MPRPASIARLAAAWLAAFSLAAAAQAQAPASVLRVVPHADLTLLDPGWAPIVPAFFLCFNHPAEFVDGFCFAFIPTDIQIQFINHPKQRFACGDNFKLRFQKLTTLHNPAAFIIGIHKNAAFGGQLNLEAGFPDIFFVEQGDNNKGSEQDQEEGEKDHSPTVSDDLPIIQGVHF